MTGHIPTIDSAKVQAKALRKALAAEGRDISHGAALELVAKSHGFHDWNTLHARAGNQPHCPVALGQTLAGRYLGQGQGRSKKSAQQSAAEAALARLLS